MMEVFLFKVTPIPLTLPFQGTSPLKGEGYIQCSPLREELANLKGWSEGVTHV